jgi:hypothetical protein
MVRSATPKGMRGMIVLALAASGVEAKTDADIEQRIRRIVDGMMQEKDAEIAGLKARVQDLEAQLRQMPKPAGVREPRADAPAQAPPSKTPPAPAEAPNTATARPVADEREMRKLKRDVEKLKEAEESRLKFNGFFDMSAKTRNPEGKTFDFGSIELDIEFQYLEHFAGSGAFVWDGNNAEATVAVLDYHQFDRRTPPRGRIFLDPGFHLQGGKFDLPYALDYQYFAARDRWTVTPPLTTVTIQDGGFNSEGIRTYGRWDSFDYSVFWTNPVYGDRGSVLGGRLGKNFGAYPFHMAGKTPDLLGLGFSFLVEWGSHGKINDYVYGADFNFNYEALHIWSEALWRDARQALYAPDGANLGNPSQSAYHVTVLVNLAEWLEHPLYVYGRYGNWNPDFSAMAGDNDVVYEVRPVDQVTLGLGWAVNDYVKLKFEYDDALGTQPDNPRFTGRVGIVQLVVAF